MEKQPKARLPWAIVLLIVVLACAIAWGGATLYKNFSGSSAFSSFKVKQLSGLEKVEAVCDGFVYYDGSAITKVNADARTDWSYMMGTGAEISASSAGVAAWNGDMLTLIDGKTGVTSFSNAMDGEILSARMGSVYTAVVLGPEHNSTIVLMENGGRRVDSITLTEQTVVDYGFFYNDTLFWVMALDTSGTVPSCTISTYRPGRRIVGSITDGEQVLYRAMFRSSQILVAGETHMKVYDYNGKEIEEERKLVYGWTLAAADDEADVPMMAYVPNGQYDGSSEMKDVQMIRGSAEQMVRMPFNCTSLVAKGSRVYGFSSEGYIMIAEMGRQQVSAYRVNVHFEEVIGVADNGTAILRAGDNIFLVSLE